MRLRRVTAYAAAAAVAGVTLTAAVNPSPPADPPVSLPALTRQALAARYAASCPGGRPGGPGRVPVR